MTVLGLSEWYFEWLEFWTRHHYSMREVGVDLEASGPIANRWSVAWRMIDEQGRYSWRPAAP